MAASAAAAASADFTGTIQTQTLADGTQKQVQPVPRAAVTRSVSAVDAVERTKLLASLRSLVEIDRNKIVDQKEYSLNVCVVVVKASHTFGSPKSVIL